MKTTVMVVLLSCLVTSTIVFGQSSNATVSGTVSDATGAILPSVTITATNNATGVVTTVLSNEAGAYNFPSLLPGAYKLSAELPGFQTQTYTDVQLGNAQQVRLNFTLNVAGGNTAVEVTVAADTLLATSSSSVGEVLSENKVRDLPVVGNNVLDLISVMAGVRITNPDAVFGADATTFAGISARNSNVQRDGVTVDAGGRYPTGVQAATRMNPDLVGEVRMILTPVDAEVGRGNGQIQLLTRSGGNEYHGAGVFYVRNTALDANTWANNRTQPRPPARDWRNLPQYTGSIGGPIVKNQTFFFALYDGVLARTRSTINTLVLTPCARNGIFRYYDNWNNGDAQAATVNAGATPTIGVVDALGNPRAPAVNPDGTAHNGILRYASVFGRLQNTPTRADCSDAVVAGSSWDTNRTGYDPTGYIRKVLNLMPEANAFDGANVQNVVIDGLNTANHRWVRRLRGSNNLFSIGEEQDRNQINLKIDHNFSARHKVNGAWSYERASSDDAYKTWPDGWGGTHYSRPMVLTSNFTSTLSSSIVNEARFGMRRTGSNPISPIETEGSGEEIRKFIFEVAGIPVWPHPGSGLVNFQNSQPPGGRGAFQITQRDITPLYTYADSLSWTKGKHAYKFGGEVRFAKSKAIQNGLGFGGTDAIHGRAVGGDAPLAQIPAAAISNVNVPGLAGTTASGNNQRMRNLLSYLSGSMSSINEAYYINSPTNLSNWQDYRNSPYVIRDFHQNEFAFFVKDDWKLTKDLTLNLGIRYEYFGVPYEANGLTAALVGGGGALFGVSGRDFNGWMQPGARAELTALEFVGPNSPNPDKRIYPKDRNNWGPAVGFAWSMDDKTTMRGGYQITYQGTQRGNDLQSAIGFPPGSIFRAQYSGLTGNEYLDLTDLGSAVPVPPVANAVLTRPMLPIAITDRTQQIQGYDPNFVTPYVQNMTLSVTRNLTQKLVTEVKYVGTLGLKQYTNINLNIPNFLYNGLKEAFDAARSGGESALLDNMLRGVNLGQGTVGQGGFTGAAALRGTTMTTGTLGPLNQNLANGKYADVATIMSVMNYSKAGGLNPTLPDIPLGVNGAALRVNGVPENFILTNPQFVSNNGVTYRTNLAQNNYHSMEAQLTLRPSYGVGLQGTYTWSKNLGNIVTTTNPFTNPVERSGDYTLQAGHRTHDFRTNGTFELPFGPGRPLLGNSSGWLARLVERWEASWIVSINSGPPMSINATCGNNCFTGLYANSTPDIVGPFPFKDRGVRWGGVRTSTGLLYGSYWDPAAFTMVRDPQCGNIAANLQSMCTLTAVADARTGQILLQNPQPGRRGTLGHNAIEGPGQWRFDAAMRKEFRVGESKSVQVRVDAVNVLNHPEPQTPNLSINPVTTGASANTNFGTITTKTLTGFIGVGATQRIFQAQLRFNF